MRCCPCCPRRRGCSPGLVNNASMNTALKRQRISVLGATGSIGRSTLDVLARHPDRFEVVALTAHSSVEELAQLAHRHKAKCAAISDASQAARLRSRLGELGSKAEVLAGEQGLVDAASLAEADTVMAAIVGAAGLKPTLAAAKKGRKLLLANKEAIVMAGPLFMEA